MTVKVELNALLDLALGQSETGAVNFKILHGFLKKLLGHLPVSDDEVEENDHEDDKDDSLESLKTDANFQSSLVDKNVSVGQPNGAVENRIRGIEDRLRLLDSFSASEDILKWAKGRGTPNSQVSDIWNFMNMQKRLEATENGIKKVTSVVDKILLQLKNVTDLQERVFNMEKRMEEVESLKNQLNLLSEKIKVLDDSQKLENLIQELANIKDTLANMPMREELESYVQWPDLQSALESRKLDCSIPEDSTTTRNASQEKRSPLSSVGSSLASNVSRHPTPEMLDTLGELGQLSSAHHKLADEVERLKNALERKANLEDLENLSSKDIPEDLIDQLNNLHDDVEHLKLWRSEVEEDRAIVASIKQSYDELKDAVEKLQNTMKHVVEEHSRKQKHIDELYAVTSKLDETKADKEEMTMQLNTKANKTDIDSLVSRQRFDENVGRLDQLLKELIDKFRASDEAINDIVTKIARDLEGKMDRDEFQDFKEYLENRLKALKQKYKEVPMMDEDPAAVFRKAMLQFNCLSCDRPVYFSGNGPAQSYPTIPAGKSGRPYTTFELDQLRMLQKGSLKPEANEYSTFRSCGGSHTSSNPTKRISAKLNPYMSSYEEVSVPPPTVRSEIDIQGQDGKLYKGRVDKNEEFPDVNRQRQMQNGRIKPKSAHGFRSSNSDRSGDGSSVPRRPKTAMHRSTTPDSPDRPQTAMRTSSPNPSTVQDDPVEHDMTIREAFT